jgi:hypothetical protein
MDIKKKARENINKNKKYLKQERSLTDFIDLQNIYSGATILHE